MPQWRLVSCSVNLPGSVGFNTGLLASHTAHFEINDFKVRFFTLLPSMLGCLLTSGVGRQKKNKHWAYAAFLSAIK